MSIEEKLNLNGEFLGVTSMAVYSAPWFLKVGLLVLVGFLFSVKIAQDSKNFKEELDEIAEEDQDDYLKLMNDFNKFFFGFTVAKKNLPVYWLGFAIFAITFVFSVIETITKIF
ncbi:MAG: hypothetical protein JW794_02540 [Candidatus Cloacimonetes bacterium]|nr:hypothetical protein [Candidatus Cloacimonadota bacterium]